MFHKFILPILLLGFLAINCWASPLPEKSFFTHKENFQSFDNLNDHTSLQRGKRAVIRTSKKSPNNRHNPYPTVGNRPVRPTSTNFRQPSSLNSFNTNLPNNGANIPRTGTNFPNSGTSFPNIGTGWNYQRRPSIGMNSMSSPISSPRIQSPPVSPVLSPSTSRRGSFGLQDSMSILSLSPKTGNQLRQLDTWEKRPINSAGLNDNCYFCTAAGLTGKSTDRLVQKTGIMQDRTGPISATVDLLKQTGYPRATSHSFPNSNAMTNYLNNKLIPGQSGKFGMGYHPDPNSNVGHMVGLKAWKTPEGQLGYRTVDFQQPPGVSRYGSTLPSTGATHLIDLQPHIRPTSP